MGWIHSIERIYPYMLTATKKPWFKTAICCRTKAYHLLHISNEAE